MPEFRITNLEIENYHSFGQKQIFKFPPKSYKKPVSIIGYNNSGKTNLINAIRYIIGDLHANDNSFSRTDFHQLNNGNEG